MSNDREYLKDNIILDWDSDFFGVPIAKIINPHLNYRQLVNVLSLLKREGVKLAYWPADLSMESKIAANENHGFHVDRKITYKQKSRECKSENPIEELKEIDDDVLSMAVQSSEFSRFRSDPYLNNFYCDRLYEEWVKKSINGEMGKAVLAYVEGQNNVGITTVGEHNGIGDIGLVAVDSGWRGKGIGSKLINHAINWFFEHDYEYVQVVTQGNNMGARKLYEKCGFKVDTIEEFYHFWL